MLSITLHKIVLLLVCWSMAFTNTTYTENSEGIF